jgi:maltokinase
MLAQLDRLPPVTLPHVTLPHVTLPLVNGHRFDETAVRGRFEALRAVGAGAGRATRVHGDFHLGQVLRTDSGWFVLDFEGEPARPLAERTRPSSPLRDVAGMIRSFQYAAEVALRDYGYLGDPRARAAGEAWEARNAEAFLAGYLETADLLGSAELPADPADRETVLAAFLLDKAIYEIGYELSHRPGWVDIPVTAVRRLLEETAPP